MTSRPLVALIYANGCPACAAAKPHFKRLAEELPSWQAGLLDIEKPGLNLDFVVEYTPMLFVNINGKRYVTDPSKIGTFTKTTMQKWIAAVVEKYKSTNGG